MSRTAVIAGATGLIGSACLRELSADPFWPRVVAIGRRASEVRGVEDQLVDFDRLELYDVVAGADVFCALGTTIRKAGSQEAFRRVDLEYPVALAKRAAAAGARSFSVVSSVGASGTSNFYLRTKAEMEDAVKRAGVRSVHVFRPSILVGARQESRPLERIGIVVARGLTFALAGPLRKYRAVEANSVAAAMVRAAREARPGVHVYHFDDIVHAG